MRVYKAAVYKGSYMRPSTVLGAIVLVSIRMNEAISACRFLKVEGSYMRSYMYPLFYLRHR